MGDFGKMNLETTILNYLNTPWGRRSAWIALALALLLLLNGLWSGVMSLRSAAVASLPNSATEFARVSVQPLPNIGAWHLFGFYHPPAVLPSLTATSQLSATHLPLTLAGIFADTDPKRSKALIAFSGQPPKSYGVGQEVPGGAKVYEILPDRVILQVGNQLERLDLPIKPLHFGPMPSELHFEPQS